MNQDDQRLSKLANELLEKNRGNGEYDKWQAFRDAQIELGNGDTDKYIISLKMICPHCGETVELHRS